ncbi:hypothetical protein L7F22_002839 [Adiantum nelumboides]|nr:hypothetical protein [Adiantum nelumboides]
MDVVPKPSPRKSAAVTEGRKKKSPKVSEPLPSKKVQALDQGVPPSTIVDPKSCKPADVTKEGKKGASKAQQPEQGLKIATSQGQDAPLSPDVPRESCQGATSKKAPKAPNITTPQSQDAHLSTDVSREPCQGVTLKKASKVPKEAQPTRQGLKIATPAGQDASLSDVPQEPCQDATLKKAPKEAQPPKQGLDLVKGSSALKAKKSGQSKEESDTAGTRPGAPKPPKEDNGTKQDLIVFEGSSPLKAQKSGQAKCYGCQYVQDLIVFEGSGPLKAQKSGQTKEVSGTAGSKPPKTQVNKRKAKADVKEKEGTTVLEQHNVKKLKKMKEVGVCEVAFERKLTIDEGKVKGHTGKGQLEKVPEDKFALKRDNMKKKSKKHVEKGLEDKGSVDKALALVGSSK